jgi:peroxiredoxin-like protein
VNATPAYFFRATARRTAGRRGVVEAGSAAPRIEFAAPPEFHGAAGFWTPEHFLVAAVASCFITTFQAVAELSKFTPEALEVRAEGVVEKTEQGYRFTRVRLQPVLSIKTEEDREQAARLLAKAARACLVSHSLVSALEFAPAIEVIAAVAGSTPRREGR